MKTLQALILVVLSVCCAAEIHEEIYNGFTAKPGQFPYQALLNGLLDYIFVETCGGSLISRNYVLTAAHCVVSFDFMNVTLGLTDVTNTKGSVVYTVPSSDIHIHPDYNPDTVENDIAVLKLPTAVTFTKLIKAVSLPLKAWAGPEKLMNRILVVSGFGITSDDGEAPNRLLQYTTTTPTSPDVCNNAFNNYQIRPGMICTVPAGSRNTKFCSGDSGGPLILKMKSDVYQVGIVSWSSTSCEQRAPTVYTDVAYFLPWINSVTGLPIH